MRLIDLDAVGGIAGDMFVAALLDAFPELKERVLADAAAVLGCHGDPRLEEARSGGLRALRFSLAVREGQGEGSNQTSFPALVARIEAAPPSPGTTSAAVRLLTILAEAEAEIHGVSVDQVHFHEIADWDSLVDMVAAGSIVAALDDTRWTVSALPRGGGLVQTAHGLLPVPAPATALILKGFAWRDDGVEGERVTPTGAAILKHLVTDDAHGGGRLVGSGTGAGTRTLAGVPNILRALVFEEALSFANDRVTVISFEVDDMTGEEIGVAAERLRAEAGVLDVSLAERWGKKGRPMQSFQLVARPEVADAVVRRCFEETSTIGVRVSSEARVVLLREAATVAGVGVKSVMRPVSGLTRKAESDDLPGGSLVARRAAKARVESDSQ